MEPYPASLLYAAKKLSGVARNKFKIVPSSSVTGAAYSVLSFQIPQGTIVDLQSLKLFLQVATASPGTAGIATDQVFARLPADITTMLQQVQVLCNGVLIGGSCTEYNSAYRLRKICASTFGRDQSIDRAVSHSTITDEEVNESGEFVVKDWLHTIFAGGREGASTRFLNTGIVGDITVRIQFSGNQVLCPKQKGEAMGVNFTTPEAATNATQMSWSYSDAYATIDAISMPPAYEDMLMAALAKGEQEIDYEEAYCWSLNNITGDAFEQRFSVSSRSLNKLFTGVRDSNYNTVGIKAHKLEDAIGDALVSNYQRFRMYPGPQYENNLWNYSLNGQLHPNFPAKLLEACADTAYVEDKMGVSGDGVLISSYADWKDGYGVVPLRLDLPIENALQSRLASGYDCRSTNASMSMSMRGMSVPAPPAGTGETAVRSAFSIAVTQPKLYIALGKTIAVSW